MITRKKIAEILNRKISYLRFFIYIFVAISFLTTALIILWLNNYYYDTPMNSFYSKPSQPPKAFLYLSPERGQYNIGDEFNIDVLVNTAGSDVVATAAYISFNKNVMQVLSIDTIDSAFSMEAEKKIDNDQGKIKITLGQPTPGVKNNSGHIATVRFKANDIVNPFFENINFDFTKGSNLFSTVIIDDKKGTNILYRTQGAKILIK